MKTRTLVRRLAAASTVTLVAGLLVGTPAQAATDVKVIASGLNSPRQLTFSPDGALYVAEAGARGDSTNCADNPLGTFCLERTGSLARVGSHGNVKRVVRGLPSISSEAETLGPFDIAFTGRHKFAMTIGLGGDPAFRAEFGRGGRLLGTIVTGDLRRHRDGPAVRKAFDAVAFEASDNPEPSDVDSNPTGLIAARHGFVYTDAGGNALVSTRRGGRAIATFDQVPTTQPGPVPVGFPADPVPTDVVVGPDGARYVSQLVGFPFEKGASTIWRVPRGGDPEPYATGLTNVTSLAFAKDGTLYAVEIAANGLLSAPPGTLPVGALVEVRPGTSTHRVVAGGLTAPYGLAIRRGSAYVTTDTFTPGGGGVVKIRL
jgi:sugar lactone lactonase YvrE